MMRSKFINSLFKSPYNEDYKSATFLVCMRSAHHSSILKKSLKHPGASKVSFTTLYRKHTANINQNAKNKTHHLLLVANVVHPVVMMRPEHTLEDYVDASRHHSLVTVITPFSTYLSMDNIALCNIKLEYLKDESPFVSIGRYILNLVKGVKLTHFDLAVSIWFCEIMEVLSNTSSSRGNTYLVSEKAFSSSTPAVQERLTEIQSCKPVKGIADTDYDFLLGIKNPLLRRLSAYTCQQLRLASRSTHPKLSRLFSNIETQVKQLSCASIIELYKSSDRSSKCPNPSEKSLTGESIQFVDKPIKKLLKTQWDAGVIDLNRVAERVDMYV